MGKSRGITLTELLVAMSILALFSSSLVATVSLALRYWNNTDHSITAQQTARTVTDIVVTNLKQALPDPNLTTGYPAAPYNLTVPTGVLLPNLVTTTSASLLFTQPNPATYDPTAVGFDPNQPQYYQRVRFYTTTNILYRDVTSYDAGGAGTLVTTAIAQPETSTGTLVLSAQYVTAIQCTVTLTCTEKGPGIPDKISTQIVTVYIPSQ